MPDLATRPPERIDGVGGGLRERRYRHRDHPFARIVTECIGAFRCRRAVGIGRVGDGGGAGFGPALQHITGRGDRIACRARAGDDLCQPVAIVVMVGVQPKTCNGMS